MLRSLSWRIRIHSRSTLYTALALHHRSVQFGFIPANLSWQQALCAAGSQDIALLRELFIHLPWQQLAPEDHHALLTEGYGSDTATALTAWTADEKLSVTYLPSTGTDGGEVTVAINRFAKPVTARWYNPANGRFAEVEGSSFANRATHRFRTPGDNGTGTNDCVLILDAGYPR